MTCPGGSDHDANAADGTVSGDNPGKDQVAVAGGRSVSGSTEWHDAREIAAAAASVLPSERVGLSAAIGRVLAEPLHALINVPHYASSAMDGWAVSGAGPWRLHPRGGRLTPGSARVVVTGELIPVGCDAVLRSESGTVRPGDDGLELVSTSTSGEPHPGQHIRPIAGEAAKSETLIEAGILLNPAHIAVSAVSGHDLLTVVQRPRVALVFTGDEVTQHGIPEPGMVRDSFGPQLPALFGMLGAIVTSRQRVADTLAATISAMTAAPAESDLLVTTGGTGDSAVDHLHVALRAIGAEILIHRVAMRPGGPTMLARLPDGRLLIALPGNPLAAMLGLLTLVCPLIATLRGRAVAVPDSITVADRLDGRPGTTMLVPYRIEDGRAVANGWLGSGMMRGLAGAAGVVVVPPAGIDRAHFAEVVALPWVTRL